MRQLRLMTLCPGHFHAALVQKFMTPMVHSRTHVYSGLDADLLAHLARIAAFNHRPENPTRWDLDIRTSDTPLERLVREQPGNTVVIAGRNRPKIDQIQAAVANNLHVLADKPWIIRATDFPRLVQVSQDADLRDVLLLDMMTERFEVTTQLQRELMQDTDIYGQQYKGSEENPALVLESVHYLRKLVAGQPLIRPSWWFDVEEAGVALADVGTHLADLALWILFPDEALSYERDINLCDATIWPTPLNTDQVAHLTGTTDPHPGYMNGLYLYAGNGTLTCAIRGVWVRLTVLWDYDSADGGNDRHEAMAQGSRSRIEIHSRGSGFRELSIVPLVESDRVAIENALHDRCRLWQSRYPGVAIRSEETRFIVDIPMRYRTDHESHFSEVFRRFQSFFQNPRSLPHWELPNLLTKYYLTTLAVELAMSKQGPLTERAH